MIDPVILSGISSAARARGTAVPAPAPAVEAGGSSFAQTMREAAQGTVDSLRHAERTSLSGLTGDSGVREVAEAVMQAERSMQTAIVVRDKIVAAWLDVSRMAI